MDHEEDSETGEVEIMIAEERERGKGSGRLALRIFLSYAKEALGIKTFIAKIGYLNHASLQLFQSLGLEMLVGISDKKMKSYL